MDHNYEEQRKFQRWYLFTQQESPEQQSQGISVQLKASSLFGGKLAQAVVKDVSLGGAGILLSAKQPVPQQFKLVYQGKYSVEAEVVYRQPLTERLLFCGIRWDKSSRHKRFDAIRLVRLFRQQVSASSSVNESEDDVEPTASSED